MRWMAIACLLLVGCGAVAQSEPTRSPQGLGNDSGNLVTGNADQVGRFKVKLTVTSPSDLKVKEGGSVVVGQILADRVSDRSRLSNQRAALLREIAKIRKLASLPTPAMKTLPSAEFGQESADIEQARRAAEDTQKQREQQQRKLDVIRSMPANELPEAVIPHEEELLKQKEQAWNTALANVELSKGKLSNARELRRIKEYEYSLEQAKQAISLREAELKSNAQIAELEARLSQVDVSLSQLSAVRSPYSGKVQRIKFVGQNDQALSIELVLVVSGNQPSIGRDGGSSQGGETSGGSSQTSGGSQTSGDTQGTRETQ
jgi:hypothetical protein